MNIPSYTPLSVPPNYQVPNPNAQDAAALQAAIELVNLQRSLGLNLTVYDNNFNNISGKFENITNLLRNPHFIPRLSQELYISDNKETTWLNL